MIRFCHHLPPMKSWLTLTDLGGRSFFTKWFRSKSFSRKRYLKNISPKRFCYDDFSNDFNGFSLRRGCYIKSVNSESCLKNCIGEFCPSNFCNNLFSIKMKDLIISGLKNLRLSKYEEKAWPEKKTENVISGYCMLVINYQ